MRCEDCIFHVGYTGTSLWHSLQVIGFPQCTVYIVFSLILEQRKRQAQLCFLNLILCINKVAIAQTALKTTRECCPLREASATFLSIKKLSLTKYAVLLTACLKIFSPSAIGICSFVAPPALLPNSS